MNVNEIGNYVWGALAYAGKTLTNKAGIVVAPAVVYAPVVVTENTPNAETGIDIATAAFIAQVIYLSFKGYNEWRNRKSKEAVDRAKIQKLNGKNDHG